MKNRNWILFLGMSVILFIASCNKSTDQGYRGLIEEEVLTTISGRIYDENSKPLQGAKVTAYGQIFTTTSDGFFLFKNIKAPKKRTSVLVEKAGFLSVIRSTTTKINGVSSIDAYLIDISNLEVKHYSTGTDLVMTLKDGSTISIPAATEFVTKSRAPYTGDIEFRFQTLDASLPSYSKIAPGGDQMGSKNGQDMYMNAYTGMEVNLYSPSGQALQMADNTTPITITQNMSSDLLAEVPDISSVYALSRDKEEEEEEEEYEYEYKGNANKNSGGYQYTVGHFSFWSTQYTSSTFGTVKCRVIDADNNVVPGVRVRVGTSYAITDQNGMFTKKVPTGIALKASISEEDFFGLSAEVDVAPLQVLQERMVEIKINNSIKYVKGEIVDCNNKAIPAKVSIKWADKVSPIYTETGIFKIPIVCSCGSYKLIVDAGELSLSKDLNLNDDDLDLGTVSLCADDNSMNNSVKITESGTVSSYESFTILKANRTIQNNGLSIHLENEEIKVIINLVNTPDVGHFEFPSHGQISFEKVGESPAYIETGSVDIIHYGEKGKRIRGKAEGMSGSGNHIVVDFDIERGADIAF